MRGVTCEQIGLGCMRGVNGGGGGHGRLVTYSSSESRSRSPSRVYERTSSPGRTGPFAVSTRQLGEGEVGVGCSAAAVHCVPLRGRRQRTGRTRRRPSRGSLVTAARARRTYSAGASRQHQSMYRLPLAVTLRASVNMPLPRRSDAAALVRPVRTARTRRAWRRAARRPPCTAPARV
jgi:hypothetical protein